MKDLTDKIRRRNEAKRKAERISLKAKLATLAIGNTLIVCKAMTALGLVPGLLISAALGLYGIYRMERYEQANPDLTW